MGHWAETASKVIAKVHAELPADADYKTRKAALSKAYPFGERAMSPYKTWCRHVKTYLARYAPRQELPMSPLERMIARANRTTKGNNHE